MDLKYTVIIPARYESTRLPGKPVADICGKPMIQRVYEQAMLSNAERVIVASDSPQVSNAVLGFHGEVYGTGVECNSGTERVAEVAKQLNLYDDDIIVNLQGDEPLMPPENIHQVAELLACSSAPMATLYRQGDTPQGYTDPNVVKLVRDNTGNALYFSRQPIPHKGDREYPRYLHHVGIYAYRVDFLKMFVKMRPSELEIMESLEQLRVLQKGIKIATAEALKYPGVGVDTEADLNLVRSIVDENEHS